LPALRTWLLGLVALAVWLLSVYAQTPPAALGTDAPATRFSALRARATLARLEGPARPHPAGSAENAAVHARLAAELAALGLKAAPFSRLACYSGQRWGMVACAEVTDLIAEVAPGDGKAPQKAIVMMAHMDSVPAGPGAGDDGSGVATILETIRALKARGLHTIHPIEAVFTDGEEYGLLGANALTRDPAWRARAGIVLNMEARGSSGRSLMFQTSPGNGRLVDLYARSVPRYASSSLNAEIYRFLPNDTDLTPVLQAGLTGYNFAFVGKVANYHTPNDTVANLDPRSLQDHGENLLGLVSALEGTDFAALKGGEAAYLDLFGLWLPRLPTAWMLPLSLLVFFAVAGSGWIVHARRTRLRQALWAGAMPPALLAGCVAIGFGLHTIAASISGAADPSFAHPWALRLALALGVWGITLLAARLGAGAVACWLWLSGLGVVTAALLPGLSPFFVFPSLVGAAVLPFAAERRWLLLAPALAGLTVWLGLTALGEELLGLKVHPLFTVTAAFATISLAPLLPRKHGRDCLYAVVLAVIFAVIAGFLPPTSASQPERLNLRYVESEGRAQWAADPVRRLPRTLRQAGHFPAAPQTVPGFGVYYLAPAGKARLPAPSAAVSRNGALVTFRLHGSSQADAMVLSVPAEAGLVSAAIGDWTFALRPAGRFSISCATAGCRDIPITLGFQSAAPLSLSLSEQRFGLPPGGDRLQKARGAAAAPSQFGDQTLLMTQIAVPGR